MRGITAKQASALRAVFGAELAADILARAEADKAAEAADVARKRDKRLPVAVRFWRAARPGSAAQQAAQAQAELRRRRRVRGVAELFRGGKRETGA